jgi:hypothetical protein
MNERITGWKWIPVGILLVGVILRWIHVDEGGVLLGIGVLCFGVMALIEGIKGKYYKQLNIDTLLIILPLLIITAAIGNIVTGHAYYVPTLVIFLAMATVKGRKQLIGSLKNKD